MSMPPPSSSSNPAPDNHSVPEALSVGLSSAGLCAVAHSGMISEDERLKEIVLMTSGIVGAMPLQEQVALLAERVQSAFGAEGCVIRELEGEQLRYLASSGFAPEDLRPWVPAAVGAAAIITGEKKPVFVSDVRSHPLMAYIAKEDPQKLLSYAGAPLLAENEVIGVIGVFWKKQVPVFSKNDLEHLQIVANHISICIANDRLYKELRAQKERLVHQVAERSKAERRNQAFSLLGQRLTAARNDREVADVILEILDSMLGWDSAYVFRYDAARKTKAEIVHYDIVDGKRSLVMPSAFSEDLSPKLREVVDGNPLFLLRKPKESAQGFHSYGNEARPSASMIIVPMRNRGVSIGVLSIQSYTYDAYTNEDINTLQTMADLCGGVLERINAQQALAKEHTLLRTLLDHLPDYIYVKDTGSKIILDNLAHRKLLGASKPDDVLGKTVSDYFTPDLSDRFIKDDQMVFETQQPLFDREEPIVAHDGFRHWLLTTKVPLQDDKGKVVGLVGISRDITRQKTIEAQNAAFSSLGKSLSSATNMSEAGRIILEIANELLGWDSSFIHLYSEQDDALQSIVNIDLVDGVKTDVPSGIFKPTSLMRLAVSQGGQLILRGDSGENSSGLTPFGDANRPSAAILMVPIRNNQRVTGFVSIQSYTQKAYNQQALKTLQALADHCAGALERLRVDSERKEAEKRNRVLSELARHLSSATTETQAAEIIIASANELFHWDACRLDLYFRDRNIVRPLVAMDIVGGKRSRVWEIPDLPPSKMALRVFEHGPELILRENRDALSTETVPFGDANRSSASLMNVPIRHNQKVIGFLSIQSYTPRAYNRQGLKTLEALADHCAGALERLRADMDRTSAEKQNVVFTQLAGRLSGATTDEEAADIIIASASELFNWDACSLDLYFPESNLVHSLVVIDTIDGEKTRVRGLQDVSPSGMAREVFEHGAQLILRDDIQTLPSNTLPFGDKNRPSASLMNVPIRDGDKITGFLSIQSYTSDAYTQENLGTLQSLADHCGGTLARLKNNQALRDSEERFRSLSESAPMGIFRANAEGLRTYINQRWYEITGMPPKSSLGMDWIRSIHPEDRDKVRSSWQQAVKEGVRWESEHRKLTSDGTTRWVRAVATPIVSADGNKSGFVGIVEDISEKKKNDERTVALSQLGKRLSSATSRRNAARIISEATEKLFHCDAFFLDLYSVSTDSYEAILNLDTVNGQKVEVADPSPNRKPSAFARRIMENGPELILKQIPGASLGGTLSFGDVHRPSASLMFVPLRGRTGVIGVMSVQSYSQNAFNQEDLTTLDWVADYCAGALERIRTEEALLTSEIRFQSVWESSVDGMRLTDENGIIIAVNQAYCSLVGMSREELEGNLFTAAYADSLPLDDFIRKYKMRFEGRLMEKFSRRNVTFRSGKNVELEDTNSFIEARDGRTLLLGLFRDVTAQKRLEEELRQTQKMETVGRLAGGIAHDFNNILTVISGHAQLVQLDHSLSTEVAESLEQISAASDRAAGLTRQLLAFGRKQVIQARNLDFNDVVSNMTKMLQRVLGEDIALEVRFQFNLPPVHADSGMMEQILLNLAVNSRDAMPQGGKLHIRTSSMFIDSDYVAKNPDARSGHFISLSVTDTGCGIPKENLQKIFEPFFTTKDVGKGTGLGLATVYGIVKQHKGWVSVTSEINKGTTFEIFLPVSAKRSEETAVPVRPEMRGGSETILLVEDETEVRFLALNILKRLGYRCLEARTGIEAVDLWQKNKERIHLVLTDIVMPEGMSGRDLAERLKSESPQLKIIFTSGYPMDVIGKDFSLQEGINFIQKPYYPQKLAQTVRNCLDTGAGPIDARL